MVDGVTRMGVRAQWWRSSDSDHASPIATALSSSVQPMRPVPIPEPTAVPNGWMAPQSSPHPDGDLIPPAGTATRAGWVAAHLDGTFNSSLTRRRCRRSPNQCPMSGKVQIARYSDHVLSFCGGCDEPFPGDTLALLSEAGHLGYDRRHRGCRYVFDHIARPGQKALLLRIRGPVCEGSDQLG